MVADWQSEHDASHPRDIQNKASVTKGSWSYVVLVIFQARAMAPA
jgi:hypothetical protein